MPLIIPHGFLGSHDALGTMPAARFPGTRGMTLAAPLLGFSDTPRFAFSCWIKYNGSNGSDQQILMCRRSGFNGFDLFRDGTVYDNIYRNTSGTIINSISFGSSISTATGWHHIMGMRNNNDNLSLWYINGSIAFADTASSTNLDQDGADWYFGQDQNGNLDLDADVADFRYWNNTIPDLSDENVIDQIIRNGLPVKPAPNGAVGGAIPKIFFSAANEAWNENLGSGVFGGGDFTIVGSGAAISYVDSGLAYMPAP